MRGVVTCFSKPSGMSDFLDAAIWSMSSRRTTCRFPSASSSSTEVLVSEASSPLITRPSVVATVYWTKLPSTLRLGSRMWIKSSLRGQGGHAGEVGADLAPFAAVPVALGALLLEDELAVGGVAPFLDQRARAGRSPAGDRDRGGPPPCASSRRARAAISRLGWVAQGLFLVERQLGEPGLVLFEGVHQGAGSSRRGRARPGQDAGSHAPERAWARLSTRVVAHLGRLAAGDGLDQPAASSGEVRGMINASSCGAVLVVRGAELDELPGGIDPPRLGELLVATVVSSDAAISAPIRSSAGLPQSSASRTSCPRRRRSARSSSA